MNLSIYKDYNDLSEHAAETIIALVSRTPDAVLCLASGDTPLLTYQLVVRKAIKNGIDFSQCTFVGLDEWVGVPPTNEGSCHYFFYHHLFQPLRISNGQIHLFDALSPDLAQECRKMEKIIYAKNGIDLMLVGIGMNGHIGFNEPGVSPNRYAHVVELDEITRAVGQKYFPQPVVLSRGITLGLQSFLEAKCAVLLASGVKKASVIRQTVEDEISPALPASIIRNHSNGHMMLDEAAASALTGKGTSQAI